MKPEIKLKICKKCGVEESEINKFQKDRHACNKCRYKNRINANTNTKNYNIKYYELHRLEILEKRKNDYEISKNAIFIA